MNPSVRFRYLLSIFIIVVAALIGLMIPVASGGSFPWQTPPTAIVRLPTPTPTMTPTPSPTATFTPVPPTPTPTMTPTFTPTPVPTAEAVVSPTVESTAEVTATVAVTVTATVTPTGAPTATVAVTLTIAYDGVRVRGGPGTDYPVIGAAQTGDVFDVTGRNAEGTWWQVCCLAGGRDGWVFGGLVTLSGDGEQVPVVEVPPPPASEGAPPGS